MSTFLKKCSTFFQFPEESSVAHVDGLDLLTVNRQKSIIILTNAALYKFNIDNDNVSLESSHSILDLAKIFYREPNEIVLNFVDQKYHLQTTNSFTFANSILAQCSIIYFKINNIDLVVESLPENLITYKELTKRPILLLQTRFLAFAHHYKVKTIPSNVKVFKNWDRNPVSSITLESSTERIQNINAFTKAIAWDPNLFSLILKSFSPEHIVNFASQVVSNSIFLRALHLSNYRISSQNEFNFTLGPQCRFESINISNCITTFVFSVLNGFKNYKGKIKSISISNCALNNIDSLNLMNIIAEYPCFKHLTSFSLENASFEDIIPEKFENIFQMFTKIKEIYLNNINGDVSKHVKALLRHKNLNHIEIDKCTMKEATTMESSSENIVVLIIRDCILSQEALKGIAASILSKKRKKLCVFGLQGFMNSDQSLLYMNTLLEISPQPDIIEFDFHGFSIDQNSVNSFIEFLKTQTNLLYLGVRACFRKNTNVTLPLLADFIVKSRLSGIDISSDKLRGTPQSYVSFINSLTNCKSLTSISFMNTRLGDSGAQSIIKLAHELPSLEEISLDNIDLPSKTSFINLYSRLLEIASLRSIQTPKNDIQRLDLSNDSLPSLKKIITIKKDEFTKNIQCTNTSI
ncbi:hypothetical protein TVAG_113910 [Trichomonas vaginalis G3]|uniref:Leucine Rich Repeat family protein n=1 Tax=Trichomonas vaginalis (strain ATCC PRA-98 / G3) TaxID=412133 RepID=A2DNP4_TRIV3|nr:RNI-like family [Trichomonas vaginalis G3]EAY18047.1 hypothetical protein TVAG_113910 [Trichomonas vaginalis G3]KAI5524387.1 RNI-like family [Trichomonas vaginalis G3]|eukprot:XP_001579033.1 hypothetical protein [Trichomonas vaginalis G3]